MADDADEIPPLEDMTEVLQQAERLQKVTLGNSSDPVTTDLSSHDIKTESTSIHNKPGGDDSTGSGSVSPQKKQTKIESKQKQGSSTYGGMKKGFLFGSASGTKPKPKKVKEDIPLIKPKDSSVGSSKVQSIPEVQEALRNDAPLLQSKEWITDDLLTTIQKRPDLIQKLSDPRFSQALAKFQTNPELAAQEYASNPEIQTFFSDFSSILGDHFTNLAEKQSPTAPPSGGVRPGGIRMHEGQGADIQVHSDRPEASAEDMKQMQEILSRPGIQEIIQDPKIQSLMELLRSNPDDAQRIIQRADPEMKQKVQTLVDAGLLAFAS